MLLELAKPRLKGEPSRATVASPQGDKGDHAGMKATAANERVSHCGYRKPLLRALSAIIEEESSAVESLSAKILSRGEAGGEGQIVASSRSRHGSNEMKPKNPRYYLRFAKSLEGE